MVYRRFVLLESKEVLSPNSHTDRLLTPPTLLEIPERSGFSGTEKPHVYYKPRQTLFVILSRTVYLI